MSQIFSGILEAYAASQRPFENMPIFDIFYLCAYLFRPRNNQVRRKGIPQ